LTSSDFEKVLRYVLKQITQQLVVNKPYLIHMIRYISKASPSEANEMIGQMVVQKKIFEYLALGKNSRVYSFYIAGPDSDSLDRILSPLFEALHKNKELSIADASRITGYSELAVRTLLTHLLLECTLDCKGDLESPIFYIPWDEK
jgi:hypothetical protein